jgi:murein DD-endopeptidase MepM/ murein hydrolase activator NlpD
MLTRKNSNFRELLPLIIICSMIAVLAVTLVTLISYKVNIQDNTEEYASTKAELYQFKIRSGDNLTKIFHKAGINVAEIQKLERLGKKALPIFNLKPNQNMIISINTEDKTCSKIILWLNAREKLEFVRQDDHFEVVKIQQDLVSSINSASFNVTHSVFEDAVRAGVDKKLIKQVVDALGWEIDFAKDIRKGDQFTLLFKQYFVPGKGLITGNLEEVIYKKSGKPSLRAAKFTSSLGSTAFYLSNGSSLARNFLPAPVKYSKVSSRYSMRRKHPIIGVIRPHLGVDLVAPTGAPVWTTGAGRIAFVGNKAGYGKTIIIQHNYLYKTVYAHMSRFNSKIKWGAKVKQGDVIGYVGSTGISTGPHLHYEFRIANKQVNPMAVKIPKVKSLAKSDYELFQDMLKKNDGIRSSIQETRADE